MADSATIVAASLDSSQLEQSINKLVATVASKTKEMADNFTKEVGRMEQAVKNLGNIKIDSGGAADGGSSRRAKLFSQEGEVIQRNNQIAKEYNTTLDQQAAAIRKASQVSVRTGDAGSIRNADTLQTMNIQLDLLRERLREARNQYSSFVALASHATTTGDKGLYQFATEGVHKYGDEVRSLIPQIRGLQNAIQQMGDVIAPQGHTIQNYVNSLQKTNPELAQLNEQFKKGQSELQNQSTSYSNATQSAHQYTEEIRRQAQAIRESQQYQKGERVVIATKQDGTEILAFSEKRLSLEEQIINAKKAVVEETAKQKKEEEETVQATRLAGEELKKIYQDQKAVNEEINKRANGIRSGGTTPFQSYDNLRQSIASVLGIQEQQVKMANTEKDSYNQLSSTLKQLKQTYDALGKSDRNSDQGKALVASMHEVERAMQRIKAQASRPVSLESIIGINGKGGLSEKTLEDIAYKMQRLSSLRSGLNVETQQTEIRTVNAEYERLKKKMDEVMQKNQQMIGSNNALGRSWNYMKNRLAFYFTVGASTQFIKNLIEVRSQYEMNERALGILIGSAERGTQVFSELSQMALVSPYTLIELSNAAKQLTAYDIAAKDVVETTRRLADMASAVGVPMERLTYALGQIKAYGYLNSRDARMFANAGIPLVRELSKYYSELEGKVVSVGDVYTRMKKKAIEYNDVMAVITKMTDEGGKFFDFQAKQANTLKVQMANLDLAWNNMLNDLGKSNQGLLTAPIAALKTIFQSWKDINHIIWTLISAYSALKVAQVIAIRYEMAWATAAGGTARAMGSIGNAINGVIGKFSALVHNPWTWVFIGIGALADLGVSWYQNTKAIREFNDEIRKAADEGASALSKMLDNKGNKATQKLAKENKLTAEQGEKAWNAIKEEMETSAASSNRLIQELLKIDDINERVSKGFEYAEKINAANLALSQMNENMIKITKSWGVFGIFGEGLVDDLSDLKEALSGIGGQVGMFDEQGRVNADLGGRWEEYRDELEVTANSIKNFLDAYNIKDPLQMQEVLERVRSQIKAQNPEIQGELGRLFDVTLDQRMNNLTNGAIDANTSLWKIFMDNLRRSSSSAFSDISDDIYNENTKLTKEQQDAVDKNLEYFKKTMPYYYDAVKSMVENASQLKIQIGLTFNVQQLTDFQKEVNKRIKEKFGDTISSDQFNAFLPTSNDDLISFTKTQQESIAKLNDDNKKYEKDKSEWAKRHIAENNTEIEQRKHLLDLFNQSYAKDSKGGKGKQRDIVLDAIKEEISLTKKLQGEYDKLTSKGASHADAIKDVQDRYANTIKLLDKDLGKFGLPKFDTNIITGKDPNKQLEYFKNLRDILTSKGMLNLERSKVVDAVIQELDVSAKTYNLEKVTKGLNNELDKLKDEYELAVELDANPELGDMFADMFGINTSTLPQTFGEALDRAQDIINRKLADLNIASPFDIMQSDVNEFANSSGLEKESEAIKELAKWQNTFRDMFKKNILDSEKMLDDYVKKYGGYSDKIAEIEADRLEKIKKLNDAYYTEEMRQRPEYIAKMNAINQGASREKSNVEFDAFKNSRYYTMMFENLDYVSTKTIRDMRDRLRELMDSMNDLEPEQLKQVMTQYEKLEQKLVKRSPFKTLTKDLKNYLKTSGDRKAANEAFRNAQKEYDAQEKNVAALKEKYEQAKANNNTSQSYLDFLEIEIDSENEILQILKEQLKVAEEKADKYNLIKKLALEELSQTATMVSANLKSLAELRDQMNELFGVDASKGETLLGHKIDGMIDGLAKASDGISKVTSSAQSGNVFGVVGGVVDVFTGIGDAIASAFGGGSAKTKRLNREINESKEVVRQLSMAYDDLERAVSKSLGTAETEARRAAIANKELQLSELERQKTLEESKRSKDRDDDAIKQYEEAIHSLRNEIDDLKEDVINNLWGEDVKSAAEAFVDAWVQAWRAGETTLDAIQEKMDEMIYNLIKKAMTSKIVETLLRPVYDELNRMTKESSEGGVALTTNELRQLAQQAGITAEQINVALGEFYGNLERLGIVSKTEDESNELSALQQGIQGITEDTAGALEAYMNGVSQQVYYQSDLLTQIRDAVVGFDLDVQVATMGQILLQLQASYNVQMSIQGILDGWNNPSGQAVRVELIS